MPRRFIKHVRILWGWLTPLFFVCIFFGLLFWISTRGALQQAGLPLFMVGVLGLLVTREGRLRLYFFMPKTGKKRMEYTQAVEMERQKQIVVRQGIPALISWLFQDYMVHYPNWIHDRDNYYVPSIVREAHQLTADTIQLKLEEDVYFIKFIQYGYHTPEGEKDTEAVLELFTSRVKLLSMKMIPALIQREENQYETRWRPMSIQYVQIGEWIRDFQKLGEKVLKEIKGRKREDKLS